MPNMTTHGGVLYYVVKVPREQEERVGIYLAFYRVRFNEIYLPGRQHHYRQCIRSHRCGCSPATGYHRNMLQFCRTSKWPDDNYKTLNRIREFTLSGSTTRLDLSTQALVNTESGWENPFRPGGDLSREADEIVELIKGGKPITPTPDSSAPPLPSLDETDTQKNQTTANNLAEPITQSPKKATGLNATPKSANGNVKNDSKPTPGAVDVKRGTIKPDGEVEHVTLKKKPKCKCCVIQ